MAGRGMGAATQGGGCVGSGAKNRAVSKTSNKTGPVMMATGGSVRPMPAQANAAGAVRGQARAAAMSGRTFAKGGSVKKGCSCAKAK